MYEDWLYKNLRFAYRRSRFKSRIDKAATDLLERGYAQSTVAEKLCVWVDFACRYEDGELPSSVRSAEVNAYLDQRCKRRREGHVQVRSALRQLLHEDAHDVRRIPPVREPNTVLFEETVPTYFDFLRHHRGRGVPSVMRSVLYQFFRWLEQRNIRNLETIAPEHVPCFLAGLHHLQRSSVSQYASILRCFLRYLHMRGKVGADLARRIDLPIIYRRSHPPVVLNEDTVKVLLTSVDRTTPIGKRDFAMLLLAARYGLRPSDITALRLDQIRWRDRAIRIVQSKTQRPLELPLLADVDEAMVDYLRHGRPACRAREVFVRHRPPFLRLTALGDVLDRAFRAARIPPPEKGHRLRLFRHSAATHMLSRGTRLEVISNVLGHASVDTTRIYAQADLVGLRSVAMHVGEVFR